MKRQRTTPPSSSSFINFFHHDRTITFFLLAWMLLLASTTTTASTSSTLLKQAHRVAHTTAGRSVATASRLRQAALHANGKHQAFKFLRRTGRFGKSSATAVRGAATAAMPLTHGGATAASTTSSATSRAFLGNHNIPRPHTGFNKFSQRATRLQQELQRSFSLKAIVSDVITNKPDAPDRRSSSNKVRQAVEDDVMASATRPARGLLVKSRPPLLHDLQRIVGGTIAESWNGFVGGYLLGASMDVTRLAYKKAISTFSPARLPLQTIQTSTSSVLPYPTLMRYAQEALHTHSRSLNFGMEWARMAAVFGACRLVVSQLRGSHDEWNSVAGSALAGVIFSTIPEATTATSLTELSQLQANPVAMMRGALLYGGTMLVLHPHLWKPTQQALFLSPPPPSPANNNNNMAKDWWDGME